MNYSRLEFKMRVFVGLLTLISFGNAFPSRLHDGKWHSLIVGGKPATQGEVPYQLGLRYYGEHRCGASLIVVEGVTVGLTAAHCTAVAPPLEAVTLVAGDLSLSESSGIEQTRQVVRIVNHEGFDSFSYENDIALLFLNEPYELNTNVQPIALPDVGTDTDGNLFVSGWGRLSYEGDRPDTLHTVEVPIVDDQTCQTAYDELGDEIFQSFICAGYLGVGGKDACQGDSGGPARSIDGNYLAGIVSWGEGCADPRYPGVYTEVSHFVDWIRQQVVAHFRETKKTSV